MDTTELGGPIVGGRHLARALQPGRVTRLHFASDNGDTESCLRLIASGVDVALSDFQGRSPVALAKGTSGLSR